MATSPRPSPRPAAGRLGERCEDRRGADGRSASNGGPGRLSAPLLRKRHVGSPAAACSPRHLGNVVQGCGQPSDTAPHGWRAACVTHRLAGFARGSRTLLVAQVLLVGLSLVVLVRTSQSRQYFYAVGVLAINLAVVKAVRAQSPFEPWRGVVSRREYALNKVLMQGAVALSAIGWIATGAFAWVYVGVALGGILTVGHRSIHNRGGPQDTR